MVSIRKTLVVKNRYMKREISGQNKLVSFWKDEMKYCSWIYFGGLSVIFIITKIFNTTALKNSRLPQSVSPILLPPLSRFQEILFPYSFFLTHFCLVFWFILCLLPWLSVASLYFALRLFVEICLHSAVITFLYTVCFRRGRLITFIVPNSPLAFVLYWRKCRGTECNHKKLLVIWRSIDVRRRHLPETS
jgi:hypothetical protein